MGMRRRLDEAQQKDTVYAMFFNMWVLSVSRGGNVGVGVGVGVGVRRCVAQKILTAMGMCCLFMLQVHLANTPFAMHKSMQRPQAHLVSNHLHEESAAM